MDDELKATLVYNKGEASSVHVLDKHLRAGEIFDAALAARALGKPAQAAELFERVSHFAEAAACWHEAKDYRRCLRCCGRVPRDHALYPSCARLAVEAACALNEAGLEFDAMVSPWLKRGPRETYDNEVFLELGELYVRLGRKDAAQKVYERLVRAGETSAHAKLIELQTRPWPKSPKPESGTSPLPESTRKPARSVISANSEAPPGPGSLLAGRYRLDEMVGHGGSASVYKATDIALDQQVALKLFGGPFDSDRHARFKREINLARRLAHPNIVRIFDLVLATDVQGLTMELIEGVSLDAFVKMNKANLAACRELLIQAAGALGYAHSQGVIHRDIKPDNMLVTHAGQVKITDFGIAKAWEEASITVSGAFAGTPYYVSPEQIASFRSVDHRADIYSLGVVAYELLAGRRPFEAKGVVELLTMHTNKLPEPPRKLNPNIPPELELLMLELLAKKPEDRVQSCEELARRLARLRL